MPAGRELSQLFVRVRADTTGAVESLNRFGKAVESRAQKLKGTGRTLTRNLTLPLVAAGGAAIKAAADWESSMTQLAKTVDEPVSVLEALGEQFRALSEEIPVSANELAELGSVAGQLGIETKNIVGFTETMAQLGVTTNLSAEEAATALARLANVMKTPQDQFDRMGATVVELGNNLATTEREIVEFGTRIAGAGKIAGLTEAQVLSIGGAFTSVGVEAEAGGTAFQKVILGMTQAVAEGNEDLQVFADTAGMTASEFAAAFKEDAGAAFAAFVEGLGEQGDDAFNTLEKLNLQDQRLIRSFISLAGAGDLLNESLALGTKAWEDNTALTDEAQKFYDTLNSRFKVFGNRVVNAAARMGKDLMPAFEQLLGLSERALGLLEKLVSEFGRLPKPVQTAGIVVAGLFAAIGPSLWMLGSMATGITAIGTAATVATPKIAALGATATAFGSISGPLIAFTVLMFGIRQETKRLEEGTESFIGTVKGFGSELSIATGEIRSHSIAIKGISPQAAAAAQSMDEIAVSAEDVKKNLERLDSEIKNNVKLTEEQKKALKAVADEVKSTSQALEIEIVQLTKGEKAAKDLERQLKGWNKEQRESVENLEDTRDALNKAKKAQEDFARAVQDVVDRNNDLSDSFRETIRQLEIERTRLLEGEEAARRKELANQGLTKSEQDQVIALERTNRALEEQKKTVEEAADRIQERLGTLFEDKLPDWLQSWENDLGIMRDVTLVLKDETIGNFGDIKRILDNFFTGDLLSFAEKWKNFIFDVIDLAKKLFDFFRGEGFGEGVPGLGQPTFGGPGGLPPGVPGPGGPTFFELAPTLPDLEDFTASFLEVTELLARQSDKTFDDIFKLAVDAMEEGLSPLKFFIDEIAKDAELTWQETLRLLERITGRAFEELFDAALFAEGAGLTPAEFISDVLGANFPPVPPTPSISSVASPGLNLSATDFGPPTSFTAPTIRFRTDRELKAVLEIDGRETARTIVPFVVDEIWTDTGLINK